MQFKFKQFSLDEPMRPATFEIAPHIPERFRQIKKADKAAREYRQQCMERVAKAGQYGSKSGRVSSLPPGSIAAIRVEAAK